MKKLVLGSLLLAALASQTTGCIITSDDTEEDFATITADWSFHNVSPTGLLSPENPCPDGFSAVALHTQEVDSTLRLIPGTATVDVFDCSRGSDFTDALVPAVYEAYLSVTSPGGASLYADTIPVIVDVTVSDKNFSAKIVQNGGYGKFGWDLIDMSTNALLSCADATRVDGIEINTTLVNSTSGTTDQFDCADHVAYTDAVMAGTYTVQVNAVMDATPDPIAIGEIKTLPNVVVGDRNKVTNLGVLQLRVPRL